MSKEKFMVCIACPLGCKLVVKSTEKGYDIAGNRCPKGEEYAIKELVQPTRMVTSTVKIKNADLRRLPVKTSGAIPKDLIFKCLEELNKVEVDAPIKVGDVVIKGALQLDIDIIATRSM